MDGRPTSFKPAVTATLHAPHSRLTARKWAHLWVSHERASKCRAPTRSPTRGGRGEKFCPREPMAGGGVIVAGVGRHASMRRGERPRFRLRGRHVPLERCCAREGACVPPHGAALAG